MPLLPQIQYPDWNAAIGQYGKGLQIGQVQREQNAMTAAGQAMARGDTGGAANALFQAGQLDAGLKLKEHLRSAARQADADKLTKTQRFNAQLGNLARLADTPEKWAAAVANAEKMGLDVAKYGDFGMRDYVLAQAGMAGEIIEEELKRKQLAAKTPIAPYEFTKYGVANKYTGEIRPYETGTGDVETNLEISKYEQQLRKEYSSLSNDARILQDSLGRIEAGSKLNTGAGDIAMVFGYMKALDPTSVVREGEFATAEQTAGLPQQVVAVYNRILSGQRLTPEQRAQFLEAGQALAQDKLARQNKIRAQFEAIARQTGASPERVILGERSTTTPPGVEQPPAVQTREQYDALPSGTEFIAPDGSRRVKP